MSEQHRIIAEQLVNRSGLMIFEVGCADMADAAVLFELLNDRIGEYHAFEPDPRHVKNCLSRPFIEKVKFNRNAVSNKCGNAEFRMSFGGNGKDEYSFSSSLKRPIEHLRYFPECKFIGGGKVMTTTLDTYCSALAINDVDLLWSDVQGSEDLMIEGAQRTLSRTRLFYTEHYDVEMYEGQLNLKQIIERLPGKWEIVREWVNEALLKNVSIAD